jgi:uncharacterized protein (TIGR02996 family)
MTDGYALLRAIESAPADDTPRLVYADWLDEHAGSEADRKRAEFIRLQCELVRDPAPARRAELIDYEKALLTAHGKTWVKQLPGQQFNDRFRRGFLSPVHLPAGNFCSHSAALSAVAPLHNVHLFQAREGTAKLAACPTLRQVRHLDLRSNVMRNPHVAELAKSPHLVNLHTLTAADNSIGVTGCAALAGAALPALRHLLIWNNPIKDRGLLALRSAAWFPQLEFLGIGHGDVSEEAVIALTTDPNVAGLRALHVFQRPWSDQVARAILDSPHLKNLERLWFPTHTLRTALVDELYARFGANLNPSLSLPE